MKRHRANDYGGGGKMKGKNLLFCVGLCVCVQGSFNRIAIEIDRIRRGIQLCRIQLEMNERRKEALALRPFTHSIYKHSEF